MNEIMIPAGLAPSTKFAQSKVSHDDLAAGIQASFAVISYKGKVWRVKHRGEEKMLMRADEPGVPQAFIECVIVKASPAIAKIYYKGTYAEGDMSPPDCWSVNGIAPDPASPLKQSPTCAGCPMNAWGSKITGNGKATKACQDSKRLAIVPAADMVNELHGGPMLLRVPPASLADLAQYGQKLKQIGADYFSVVTRIGFDANEAFPKFTFAALRGLNDTEADIILPLQEDPRVTRILQEAVDHVRAEPPGAPSPTTAKPAPGTAGAAKAAPTAAPKTGDGMDLPPHLNRTTTTVVTPPATAPATPADAGGKAPTPPTPPTTVAAAAPAPQDPKEAEIEALKAKLAALQGGATGQPNGAAPTPVVKRTRNKAATPTVPPPSPQPTPVAPAPVAETAPPAGVTTETPSTDAHPDTPATPPATNGTAEAMATLENELDNLL
jgi:hypothetical protein